MTIDITTFRGKELEEQINGGFFKGSKLQIGWRLIFDRGVFIKSLPLTITTTR